MIQTPNAFNLDIKLDFRSKTPLSDQVEGAIRQLILRYILKPGDPLPTVRGLASRLNVNFNTVARAYRVLDQEGWIYTHQGRGSQVAEREEIRQDQIESARGSYLKTLVDQLLASASQAGISERELAEQIDQRLRPEKRHKMRRYIPRTVVLKRHPLHITAQSAPAGELLLTQGSLPARKSRTVKKSRNR